MESYKINIGEGIDSIKFGINREALNEILPLPGVYATRLRVSGETYASVTNVGVRPTFKENGEFTIETHVMNSEVDLYGKQIMLSVEKIRSL